MGTDGVDGILVSRLRGSSQAGDPLLVGRFTPVGLHRFLVLRPLQYCPSREAPTRWPLQARAGAARNGGWLVGSVHTRRQPTAECISRCAAGEKILSSEHSTYTRGTSPNRPGVRGPGLLPPRAPSVPFIPAQELGQTVEATEHVPALAADVPEGKLAAQIHTASRIDPTSQTGLPRGTGPPAPQPAPAAPCALWFPPRKPVRTRSPPRRRRSAG